MARDPQRNRQQAKALERFHCRGGAGSVKRSASYCSLSEREFYLMVANARTTPAWLLGKLWDLYGSFELMRDLIGETARPFVFASTPDGTMGATTPAACAVLREAGHLVAELGGALSDGKLDDDERRRALHEMDELEAALATLRKSLGGGR